jgi:hypothetical protein
MWNVIEASPIAPPSLLLFDANEPVRAAAIVAAAAVVATLCSMAIMGRVRQAALAAVTRHAFVPPDQRRHLGAARASTA